MLAIDIEERDGLYTGRTRGTLTYREGKVRRLDAWLAQEGETLAGATFYSDSRNDLPLLSRVDRPHTVNPDRRCSGTPARPAGQCWNGAEKARRAIPPAARKHYPVAPRSPSGEASICATSRPAP